MENRIQKVQLAQEELELHPVLVVFEELLENEHALENQIRELQSNLRSTKRELLQRIVAERWYHCLRVDKTALRATVKSIQLEAERSR
jgi:hypothetical protein